jgi:hypothetical protein
LLRGLQWLWSLRVLLSLPLRHRPLRELMLLHPHPHLRLHCHRLLHPHLHRHYRLLKLIRLS